MSLQQALQFVPTFVLAFFRIAGMMVTVPLFGSARIPRRLKVMFALVLTASLVPTIKPVTLPATTWQLAAGIGGELLFGLAIGTALSFTFVAVNWAGEIIGQQMGLGLGQVFDPQFGGSGSVIGDLYFFLTLMIFLLINGHHHFLRGVHSTFESLPLLSATMTPALLDLASGLLQSATALALQLAAPMLVTMLVTDVVLGFLGKTIPQINVMTAGLNLRSMVGMVVLILGLMLGSRVIQESMEEAAMQIMHAFSGAAAMS
jgi:flagellar biosynthetic protein FliR